MADRCSTGQLRLFRRGYSTTMRGGARPTASVPAIFFPDAPGDVADEAARIGA
jgi:hypothetical protein